MAAASRSSGDSSSSAPPELRRHLHDMRAALACRDTNAVRQAMRAMIFAGSEEAGAGRSLPEAVTYLAALFNEPDAAVAYARALAWLDARLA